MPVFNIPPNEWRSCAKSKINQRALAMKSILKELISFWQEEVRPYTNRNLALKLTNENLENISSKLENCGLDERMKLPLLLLDILQKTGQRHYLFRLQKTIFNLEAESFCI